MNSDECYSAIERLATEIVLDGPEQSRLLSEIAQARAMQPDSPPAKALLAAVTAAAKSELMTSRHTNMIKEIAYYWI